LLLNSFSKKPIPQGFCISLGRYALWEGTHFRMDGVCGHLSMGMLSLPRPLTQLFVLNDQPLFCHNLNLWTLCACVTISSCKDVMFLASIA
jgi:hypothetical protein